MADIDGQVGVRSRQDGLDERVLVKLQDATDPGGVGKGTVVSDGKAHARIHASDSDGADKEVLLSQEGHVQSNGDYDAVNNKRPSSQGLIASDRSAAPGETTMNKRPTAIVGNDDKVAVDVAISDSAGNRFDNNNPLPVFLTEDPGTEIENFNTGSAIASEASSNHDYTVSATNELRKLHVMASSTGYAKFELQIESAPISGIFNTKAVQFNSPSNNNIEFKFRSPAVIPTGVIIRIIRTNLENKAQDLYSTINGVAV